MIIEFNENNILVGLNKGDEAEVTAMIHGALNWATMRVGGGETERKV